MKEYENSLKAGQWPGVISGKKKSKAWVSLLIYLWYDLVIAK